MGQDEGMKKGLLRVFALAVIPVNMTFGKRL
jgi:hypothetical protein